MYTYQQKLHAEFRMQIHTEFRGIPRNSGQFYCKKYRGIPYVFQKIPYSVGSQKRTSVDTLAIMRYVLCIHYNKLSEWNRQNRQKSQSWSHFAHVHPSCNSILFPQITNIIC